MLFLLSFRNGKDKKAFNTRYRDYLGEVDSVKGVTMQDTKSFTTFIPSKLL